MPSRNSILNTVVQKRAFIPIVLVIAVLALYGRSVQYPFVNWDDDAYILENPTALGRGTVSDWLTTPRFGYAIPVTNAIIYLQAQAAGTQPWIFHLTSILLHAAIAVLVYLLGRRLGIGALGAGLGAALFAVHPVVVEPAVWCTGQKDLLALLFTLLAVLLWSRLDQRSRGGFAAVVSLGILSLLSKPTLVGLPFMLLVLRPRIVVDQSSWGIRGRVALGALVACSALAVGISLYQDTAVGTVRGVTSRLEQLEMILGAAGIYAQNLVVPLNLAPRYAPPATGFSDYALFLGGLALAALIAGCIWSLKDIRRGAREERTDGRPVLSPPVAFGLLFAAAAYLPASNAVNLTRFAADSYLYAPMVGLALAAASGIEVLQIRIGPRRVLWIGLSVCLILAGLSFRQTAVWSSPSALWRRGFSVLNDSPQACRSYGNAYMWEHRPADAASVYRTCLERFGREELFIKNFGIALFDSGQWNEAHRVFKRAQRLRPQDPTIEGYLRRIESRGQP